MYDGSPEQFEAAVERLAELRRDGALRLTVSGEGVVRFTEVVLHPKVSIAPGADAEKARALHERAYAVCFIANSVNFPVRNVPTVTVAAPV